MQKKLTLERESACRPLMKNENRIEICGRVSVYCCIKWQQKKTPIVLQYSCYELLLLASWHVPHISTRSFCVSTLTHSVRFFMQLLIHFKPISCLVSDSNLSYSRLTSTWLSKKWVKNYSWWHENYSTMNYKFWANLELKEERKKKNQ